MQIKSDAELAEATPQQLSAEWAKAVAVAKEYSDYASKLKAIVLRGAFQYKGDTHILKGTKHYALGNGAALKAVFILRHKLKSEGETLDDQIRQIERLDNGILAESLFKYKVEISGSTFDALAPDHKARDILKGCVEIKSAVQSLNYGPAKDE